MATGYYGNKNEERRETRRWFERHSTPERLAEIEEGWKKEDESNAPSDDDDYGDYDPYPSD